jgi:hypothetical protein
VECAVRDRRAPATDPREPLPETVVCNADLWAACIGGAAQRNAYRKAIEASGLDFVTDKENSTYEFIRLHAGGPDRRHDHHRR